MVFQGGLEVRVNWTDDCVQLFVVLFIGEQLLIEVGLSDKGRLTVEVTAHFLLIITENIIK